MIATIPFSIVERQTAGAIRQGLSLDTILAEACIERRFGDERDMITPAQYLLLCFTTLTGIEDASHGLAKAGLAPSYPAIGVRLMLAYSTLRDALTALCRLYGTASSDMHLKLTEQGKTATVSIAMDAWTDEDAAQIEEVHLGWLFMNCLHFLGRAPPLLQVTLRDPRHHNLGRWHWAMGGVVTHGKVSAISFARDLLGESSAASGPLVFWECHERWLNFMNGGQIDSPAADYVNENGFVRFADIVRASGRSANTVRRQIQASSGSFRATRQRAIVEAATRRLCGGRDSVDAIAGDLGYSDARSFRRFLKLATGLTPQQIRVVGQVGDWSADSRALVKLKAVSERLSL